MIILRSYVQRALLALVLLVLLPLAPPSARPTLAAEGLPALVPVTSARFDYLSTIQRGDTAWTAYGAGVQLAPDRVSVWSGATSRANLATFTRIGASLSRTDGAGWRRVSDQPLGPTYGVRPVVGEQIYPVPIDGQAFASAIYFMLLIPALVPFTPALIDNAAKGEYAALTIPYAFFFGTSEGVSQGMSNSVNCSDEIPFGTEQGFRNAQGQILPELRAETQAAFDFAKAQCAIWNVPPSPAIENQPVVSDVPTLILSGQLDPITPASYGEEAAQTLRRSTVVELLGSSHDPALASPCGVTIVQRFLQNPTATLDTSCADDAPIVFATEIPAVSIARTNTDVPTP